MKKRNFRLKGGDKKKINRIFVLLVLVPVFLIIYFLSATAVGGGKVTAAALRATWKNAYFYLLWLATSGGLITYVVLQYVKSEKKSVAKENDLNDSHFMTNAEIDRSTSFARTDISKLHTFADGIPLRAVETKKGMEIVFLKQPIHGNVIGSTGTGKTTGFINPIIQLFPRFKTKPSLIVTDPKGELFRNHAEYLKSQGYTVLCVDYRNPYQSAKVNPFAHVIDRIREIKSSIQFDKGKYHVGDTVYLELTEAEKNVEVRRQTLRDEINNYLMDIVETLFASEAKAKDPFWDEGARGFILAMLCALSDDVIHGKMPEEKLCLHNLYYLLSTYASSEEGIATLREYIQEHKDNLFAFSNAQTVLTAPTETQGGLIATMSRFYNFLSDGGIRCMTSGNDLSFADFDKVPTAVFVIYPDELKSRHRFVSLFLVQAYKVLVNTAERNMRRGLTDDMKLLRNCYFIMDEFGNLPRLHNFDDTLSIARSRKIFFLCVLQSYAQLDTIYGEKPAEKILSQLQIKIFIGTDDLKTIRAFSEICGKKKIVTLSTTAAVGRDANDSYAAKEQPLISPQELQLLCKDLSGDAVVSCLGQYPIMTAFTPSYKARAYKIGDAEGDLREAEVFNEKDYQHDIAAKSTGADDELELDASPDIEDEDTGLSQEEIDALEAEEKLVGTLKKAEDKVFTLLFNRDKSLNFMKDFLPEGAFELLSAASPASAAAAAEKLALDGDVIQHVRLKLTSFAFLCKKIEEANNEYKKLLKQSKERGL